MSVQVILPEPQTEDGVISDILIPTKDNSSAKADHDHWEGPHGPHGSEYKFANSELPAELVALLEVAADRVLKESCGEGWLMQPRIADMTRLEYRVYMLNGAQAVSSLLSRIIYMCWLHVMQNTALCSELVHSSLSVTCPCIGYMFSAQQCVCLMLLMHKLPTHILCNGVCGMVDVVHLSYKDTHSASSNLQW